MKGDPDVITALNELLTTELTAINQYFIHHKMCEDWGYEVLSKQKRKYSIEQMWHADWVIARILLLEGVPNMQRLFPVKVGEDPVEQHELDHALEVESRDRLNQAIELARSKGDNGTRELLERVLVNDEAAQDWLEAQMHLVEEVGKERYLAEQIHGDDD